MLTRRAAISFVAALAAGSVLPRTALAAQFPGREGLERMAEALARRPFGAPWRTLLEPDVSSAAPEVPRSARPLQPLHLVSLPTEAEFVGLTEVFVNAPSGSDDPSALPGAFEVMLADRASRAGAVFQFLGATLFRLRALGQDFGVAARGIAIRTADPRGEEIPVFRALWVGRQAEPSNGSQDAVVIDALLDSASMAAAYRLVVRPRDPPAVEIEATLFARETLRSVGIAPLTATFLHAAGDGRRDDDWRPSVHEARGLLMLNGRGERLWRTLTNPESLQISAFADRTPRAFGLIQRDRRFGSFMDTAAGWENRPSMIVEPDGDWGPGWVVLVEIPSRSEANDNVQVFWQPETPIAPQAAFRIRYRIVAADDAGPTPPTAVVDALRTGAATAENGADARMFVLDYRAMPGLGAASARRARASVRASAGLVRDIVVQHLPDRRMRTSFVVERTGNTLVELRADLFFPDAPPAEVWLHRWS